MTTREKIIVGLMLVVVAFGAYELFLAPTPGALPIQTSSQGLEPLNDFINKVADANQKGGLSETEAYKKIIGSSQRSNKTVNRALGVEK